MPSRSGLLHSSNGLGWNGIVVEHHVHGAGEWQAPALAQHMACVNLGTPVALRQSRGERFVDSHAAVGSCELISQGTPSCYIHAQSADFVALHVSPLDLQRCYESSTDRDGRAVTLQDRFSIADPQLEWLARELHGEMLAGGPGGTLYAESLAAAVTALLLRRYGAAMPKAPRPRPARGLPPLLLQRLLDHIHTHLCEPLRLADLAALCHCSPGQLIARFKVSMGRPPHDYVTRCRVERAVALMHGGGLSMAEVAQQVGFYDQSHLRRHLRRLQHGATNPSRTGV
jgi:AraC family transcriptional regulator